MEPDNLNSTPPDDAAQLDRWLQARATLPPVPDDGFSRRVLSALPAPVGRAHLSPRLLAILVGAAVGAALATFKVFTAAPVEFALPASIPGTADALAQLADPKLHVALGVTVITLAFVFWRDVRRRVGL